MHITLATTRAVAPCDASAEINAHHSACIAPPHYTGARVWPILHPAIWKIGRRWGAPIVALVDCPRRARRTYRGAHIAFCITLNCVYVSTSNIEYLIRTDAEQWYMDWIVFRCGDAFPTIARRHDAHLYICYSYIVVMLEIGQSCHVHGTRTCDCTICAPSGQARGYCATRRRARACVCDVCVLQ